jgi:predicted RNase H-like HicB family nuclease
MMNAYNQEDMSQIQPIRVDVKREADGRWLATVPDLPGVLAYGSTEVEAIRKARAMALEVVADLLASSEDAPRD